MKRLLVGALCLTVCACSSDKGEVLGPTQSGQASPSERTISFVSGETKQPVAGASVIIFSKTPAFSKTYMTDAEGHINLGSSVSDAYPLSVEITASGYLDRTTYLRSADEVEFTLWPSVSPTGLDDTFTSALVYSASSCPAQSTSNSVALRMNSSVKNVWITFDSTLTDPQAQAVHSTAAARLTSANGGAITYGVSASPPPDSVVFTARIDPNAATCTAGPEPLRASTSTTLSSSQEIVGGGLVYCTVQAARSVSLVLHELGHTYGLRHAPTASDVMYCSSGRPTSFTARERLTMSLMRQRRPGNRWPDNDRQAVAPLRSGSEVDVQICGDY